MLLICIFHKLKYRWFYSFTVSGCLWSYSHSYCSHTMSSQPSYLSGRGRGRGTTKQSTPSGSSSTQGQTQAIVGNGPSQRRPGHLATSGAWSGSGQSLKSPSFESQRLESCKKDQSEQCKWNIIGLYCMMNFLDARKLEGEILLGTILQLHSHHDWCANK